MLSQPQYRGERSFRRIEKTFEVGERPIAEVVIRLSVTSIEKIRATLEHPFWVKDTGWTGLADLNPGDKVELSDGREATIETISDIDEISPVFNFAVEGFHTYYVGQAGVWVHNASSIGDIPPLGSAAIKDLRPLHSAETVGSRPDLARLSDNELLQTVINPRNGDGILINTRTGNVVDGNSRLLELQRRAANPTSSITHNTQVPVRYHSPDNSMFWDIVK